ncbi:MAG: apolipoprotein N-acyltransferase [Thermoguttaceae bacterium]|jgi:apolipoprotein N-acyltransferase
MQRSSRWLEAVGGWTFTQAMLGAVGLWAALPPLGLWPLAWIAPLCWVRLIRRPEWPLPPAAPRRRFLPVWLAATGIAFFLSWLATNGLFLKHEYRMYWAAELVFWPLGLVLLAAAARLARRRPYAVLWLVGFFFWLAALQWLRLPHWATGAGWLAVSFYFAFYLPVFVAVSRCAVHRLGVPVIAAAPVVWTGLELARAHLLTGMTMASLGHTQYRWTTLIQVSDLGGAFTVSFLVMFVAACLARAMPCGAARWTAWPLAPAAGLLAAALCYGHLRTSHPGEQFEPIARIALIQGAIDIQMDGDRELLTRIDREYGELSVRALRRYGKVDLMVWPESMRPDRATVLSLCTPLVFGTDRAESDAEGERFYNTAVYLSPTGDVLGHYDKMQLVMFGEYVPWSEYLPWLARLTPLPISATAGREPNAFAIAVAGGPQTVRIAPNICYESVLSHVIRGQVRTLKERGQEPDVLVNLTNDGWFWGSSELEMHLACGVFRAVECRKPLLIAANTGISAWIDGDGRIRAEGPRRQPCTLLAEVCRNNRHSDYLQYGDWPAGVCLAAACVFALAGVLWRRVARP